MLPLEKCLELKDAGFTCETLSVSPVDRFYEYCYRQLVFIPSGDELLAECRKELPSEEWSISRIHFKLEGRDCTTVSDGNPNGVRKHWCGRDNSDLADAWRWLNERKKRND